MSNVLTGLLAITLIALTATIANFFHRSLCNTSCDSFESKTKLTETLEQVSTVNPQDLRVWSLKYEVFGGIAGLKRRLLLSSNQQLIAIDEKRSKRIIQQASPQQITNVTTLLKSLKMLTTLVASSSLNSQCADCFQYRLTLTLNEQQQIINLDDSQIQHNSKYAKLISLLSSILNQTLSQ